MTHHGSLRHSPDVVFRELDGETVLLDFQSGRYFGLNAVGTRVWTLLASGRSLDDITQVIADEFDVPHGEAAQDIEELVTQLVSRGLLVAASKPDAAP